ncbi:14679_t:CDS:1, partial [Racocetra fulgida]
FRVSSSGMRKPTKKKSKHSTCRFKKVAPSSNKKRLFEDKETETRND